MILSMAICLVLTLQLLDNHLRRLPYFRSGVWRRHRISTMRRSVSCRTDSVWCRDHVDGRSVLVYALYTCLKMCCVYVLCSRSDRERRIYGSVFTRARLIAPITSCPHFTARIFGLAANTRRLLMEKRLYVQLLSLGYGVIIIAIDSTSCLVRIITSFGRIRVKFDL